jgi:hypothetical protein
MVTLSAAFLFFATGGLIFETWHNVTTTSGLLIGSGVMAFINGFVHLGEFALILFRYD